jgi:hypothetical protein
LETKQNDIANRFHQEVERRCAEYRATEGPRLAQERDAAIKALWQELVAEFGGCSPLSRDLMASKNPVAHKFCDAVHDGTVVIYSRDGPPIGLDLNSGAWLFDPANNTLRGGKTPPRFFAPKL